MGESAWKTPTWYRQVIKVDISHLSRTFVCILMLATLRQGCQMSLLWYSQPRPRQPTLSFPGNKTNMHARANKDLHGTHFLITFNGERYSGFQKKLFYFLYDSILSWCILMIRKIVLLNLEHFAAFSHSNRIGLVVHPGMTDPSSKQGSGFLCYFFCYL